MSSAARADLAAFIPRIPDLWREKAFVFSVSMTLVNNGISCEKGMYRAKTPFISSVRGRIQIVSCRTCVVVDFMYGFKNPS